MTDRDVIIKEIDKQVANLPAFSPVLSKILKVIDNPISSAADIEKVLKYDQSLSSRVLKMANSAYYGYAGKISTISQGVVVLGLNTLRALIFTASASRTFAKKLYGYKLGEGDFWKHSVMTAIGARALATRSKYPNPDEAFVAGLMHDIGKLILDSYVKPKQDELIALLESSGKSWAEVELELIGINHAQVGRRLCEKWNLPPALTEAVGLHHTPDRASVNKTLTSIITLVNRVTWGLTYPDGDKIGLPSETEVKSSIEFLKMPDTILHDLEPKIQMDFKDAGTLVQG